MNSPVMLLYLQEGRMIFHKEINALRRETGEEKLGKPSHE
jgi:hypothetical protein